MSQMFTVLTGDLIGSTQAGQALVDEAMDAIHSIALGEANLGNVDLRFARFRGDGWQIFSSDPARVFRLTVRVLASLHSRPTLPKTRISAATGQVAFLPPTGLASASGEVFSISGRNLDNIGRSRLVYQDQNGKSLWKLSLFSYLTWQSSRWSPEQAEAIAMTFRFDAPEPGDSAETLRISRQAFSARLDGAGYAPLWDAEQAFKNDAKD